MHRNHEMDLQLEDAIEKLLARVPSPVCEEVPLDQAAGRIAARRVLSPIDLPPFDNSAMDGYAVRSGDLGSANPLAPARLRLVGKSAAGQPFDGVVSAGACVRLFTGSVLPAGADAVVMQEDTRAESSEPHTLLALDSVSPGENVRRQGEDVRRGTPLCEAGEALTAGRIWLLGAAGVAGILVARRPVIGLLATGSELKEPGESTARGQIYESNRIGLATLIERAGALPKVLPIVPDQLAATQRALAGALENCDAVVSSGGVSVGELDFVKQAFEDIGGRMEFWRVAIKPGRPFVFGRRREKLLFGLPGNPVSALVTFLLLVRPALLRLQGAKETSLPAHPGRLAGPLSNAGNRRHFMRVHVDSDGAVESAGEQASHILSSVAAANGLVDVPPATVLPGGSSVRVLRWE